MQICTTNSAAKITQHVRSGGSISVGGNNNIQQIHTVPKAIPIGPFFYILRNALALYLHGDLDGATGSSDRGRNLFVPEQEQ